MKRSSPLAQFSHCACSAGAAFTLIELMVVVTIIAVLAGLALGSLGYVNRKGAASRAQSEVVALASAIENYKLDIGAYPASNNLYNELTAGGPVNTKRVYFQPTPGMVNTNVTPRVFQDPYGANYQYSTTPTRNIGFFDLYCVPPGETNNPQNWIHN
jgi:type II secretion system protein G